MVEANTIDTQMQQESTEQIPAEEEKKEAAPARPYMPTTLRDQFLYGLQLKDEGNQFFKQQDYAGAIKKYSKIRAFLKPMMPSGNGDQDNTAFVDMIGKKDGSTVDDKLSVEEKTQAIQCQTSAFLNLSICFFLTQDYRKSIDRATESLNLQQSVKAYYRRAKGKAAIKDYWGAAADIKEAMKIDHAGGAGF